MTRASSMSVLWRWTITVAAVVVAFFAALYFSLFVLMFGAFPKDLAGPTSAFLTGLLVALAGSLAPRHRVAIALILCVSGMGVGGETFLTLLGALGGGIVAVAFVAWW